jgi:hypothetical protein
MSTITQRTKNVEVYVGDAPKIIIVRRMSWKAATDFIKALGDFLRDIFAIGDEQNPKAANLFEKIPGYIVQSDEMVIHLLTHATQMTPDEIGQIDASDVLLLVNAAIEINLDEKTKNSYAGIVALVRGFATPKS